MILGPFKGQIGSTYNLIKLCFQKVQPLIAPYLSCSSALFLSVVLCFNVYGTGESSPIKRPPPPYTVKISGWYMKAAPQQRLRWEQSKQIALVTRQLEKPILDQNIYCTSDVWWPNGVCSCVDKKWAFERIPKVPKLSYIHPLCSESSELGACPLSYHT